MKDMHNCIVTRREALARCGMGFGALALSDLLRQTSALASPRERDADVQPLAPHGPHATAKARRVIHLFMNGGPSQVDTFDPKPKLAEFAGKSLPMENLRTERKTGAAFPSPYKFKKYGQSGIEVSEIFEHTAQ